MTCGKTNLYWKWFRGRCFGRSLAYGGRDGSLVQEGWYRLAENLAVFELNLTLYRIGSMAALVV